ncbi:MAG: 5-dehydro-4-deoxy-D-glucuronate isomerase [Acidimicrobiia bacterium]|nr:MAG: 5-dehydro-4-deoxy-D-glucuronate isomerase [Acidimicrobiia bacterium]
MEQRYPIDPERANTLTTEELRQSYLIDDLFVSDTISMVYSHIDRVIVGGATPLSPLTLAGDKKALASDVFLARREIGMINVGGSGRIRTAGVEYPMETRDGLYVGMGVEDVVFESDDVENPAHYYFMSAPAHTNHPTSHIPIASAEPLNLGDDAASNKRTIYKYIHPAGVQSCQLVMGLTLLAPNNMWNTMPPHLHARRTEVYFYFDIDQGDAVFHLMGKIDETRHLVIRNEQAVISPPWSIHSGMGTGNYAFIWAMAGENQDFTDMDAVPVDDLL